jgi:F-type H+-transporting ATPase subunit alpha
LALGERIVEVLKQKRCSPVTVGCQVAIIYAVINGYLDNVAVDKVADYEKKLYAYLKSDYQPLLDRFEKGYYEDEDVQNLRSALETLKV